MYDDAISIRPYAPDRDAVSLHSLWNRSVGDKWQVSRDRFVGKLGKTAATGTICLVAEAGETSIAFCSASFSTESHAAGLHAICVADEYRRQGVGTRLVNEVRGRLAAAGVKTLSLGSGGVSGYFWPGVPVDLAPAWQFFHEAGWRERERSVDLVRSLETYETPSWVYDRLRAHDIRLDFASAGQADELIAFERLHFPEWAIFFEDDLAKSNYSGILMATQPDGIAGSILLGTSEPVWSRTLGGRCGSFGCLGVAEQARDNGIGLALAARATEILRERSMSNCYVGWTWLIDWYGKLGFTVWSEYRMAEMSPEPSVEGSA